jgi:biotin transport system ATP-binding protein
VVEIVSDPHRHRNTVGMLFQNPEDMIVCPLVVDEVALSLTGQGLERKQAAAEALRLLKAQGLEDWAHRSVAALSQGQRQYLCWLSLKLAGHGVLLLDEPYASLDLPAQQQLSSEVAAASQFTQIIVSTHALEHVEQFDRVIWLESGRVRDDGDGKTVCQRYLEYVQRRCSTVQSRRLLDAVAA